jgi:hypothetical protein
MKNTCTILSILLIFCSCFKSYVELEVTSNWDLEKIKDLAGSGKKVEVYFTNELTVLSDPELSRDQLRGVVSALTPTKPPGVAFAEQEPNPYIRNTVAPEVQIFISDEFSEQDTVVITKNNFIQMREYRIDRPVTIMSHIGAATGILITLILVSGFALYYAYLTSNITSTL